MRKIPKQYVRSQYTAGEIAKILGVSKQCVFANYLHKQLPSHKDPLSNRMVVLHEDLVAFMELDRPDGVPIDKRSIPRRRKRQ